MTRSPREGTHWCANANPAADQLGDAQELALFDLANPQSGIQRWTDNFDWSN